MVVAEIHVDQAEEGLVILCALGEAANSVSVQTQCLKVRIVPQEGQIHARDVVVRQEQRVWNARIIKCNYQMPSWNPKFLCTTFHS